MKNKLLFLVAAAAALFLYSCEITMGTGGDTGGSTVTPPNVPPRTFWALHGITDEPYQLTANLLYEGRYCNIWAERGSGVSANTAKRMADAYDGDIYPKMIDNFAIQAAISDGTEVIAHNTLEFADYLADGDGKLLILLLNIKDNYQPGVDESYIGGYFYSRDFLSASTYRESNECDMIYIDTYPGDPGSQDSNQNFAHEAQHLMNFATSVLLERQSAMDLWINEGLSSAAEWVYAGKNPLRVNDFQNDYSGLIKEGNNFFVWGNHENTTYALLDDYSTVYLFFQYLRAQSSPGIYYDIMTSSYTDYRAVTQALRGNNDWGTLLKTWLAANYINAPSGEFGYKNDPELRNIRAKTAPTGRTSYLLAPGEAVYSITNSGGTVPRAGTNIKYAGLDTSAKTLSDSATFPGGALLSYNANINTRGGTESGTTTGVAASVDAASGADASRGVMPRRPIPGPFRIDMGDMLRRNGHELNPLELVVPEFSIGLTADE